MNNELNLSMLNSTAQDLGTQKIVDRPQVQTLNKLQSAEESSSLPSSVEKSDEKITNEELESVVTEMNSVAQNLQRNLLFSVDENTGGTFVKVIDKETEETVREIPSKEIREIKARLEEVAGLIFKDSV